MVLILNLPRDGPSALKGDLILCHKGQCGIISISAG